jgi:hypothetical protein
MASLGSARRGSTKVFAASVSTYMFFGPSELLVLALRHQCYPHLLFETRLPSHSLQYPQSMPQKVHQARLINTKGQDGIAVTSNRTCTGFHTSVFLGILERHSMSRTMDLLQYSHCSSVSAAKKYIPRLHQRATNGLGITLLSVGESGIIE